MRRAHESKVKRFGRMVDKSTYRLSTAKRVGRGMYAHKTQAARCDQMGLGCSPPVAREGEELGPGMDVQMEASPTRT